MRQAILPPLWLGGIALWLTAWAGWPGIPRGTPPLWAALAGLIVLAAALRLISLETLQNGNHDEFITPDMAIVRTCVETSLPLFDQRPRDIGSAGATLVPPESYAPLVWP